MSVLSFLLLTAIIVVHIINVPLNHWTFVGTCIALGLTEIAFAIESFRRRDK